MLYQEFELKHLSNTNTVEIYVISDTSTVIHLSSQNKSTLSKNTFFPILTSVKTKQNQNLITEYNQNKVLAIASFSRSFRFEIQDGGGPRRKF